LRIAARKLTQHARHLLIERYLPLTIVGPLTQYEGFDDRVQKFHRQLGVRDDHGFTGRLAGPFPIVRIRFRHAHLRLSASAATGTWRVMIG
jgi:hypothetical protein